MKSWKTTFAGVGMILMGLGGVFMTLTGHGDTSMDVSAGLIVGGIGLLVAGDHQDG